MSTPAAVSSHYAPETTIAEKGVTILERGITSTRWRDDVDIVAPHLSGYGAVGQAKWAAWRRKEHRKD